MLKGHCLCGDIAFETSATPVRNSACHCSQCRRQSGHVWASVDVPESQLSVVGNVSWYAASPSAKRGFCPRCGSFLFWKENGADLIAIGMGALDQPSGLRLERHIFVADKGDYYDIDDGLPQVERS